MTNRDQFVRRTAQLASQEATRPLTRPDPIALASQLKVAIEKTSEILLRVEAPLEWLHQACIRAKLPLPGVPDLAPRHALTPQAEELITYLFAAFRADPLLAQVVQVAVFRFYDARKSLRFAQIALDQGKIEPDMAEQLRLRAYYLVNLHADFRRDRVLSQVFPAPRTMKAAEPAVPLTNVQRLKQKLQKETAFNKAEATLKELAPRIQQIKVVLEMIDSGGGVVLRDLMLPEVRRLRIVAIGLKTDEAGTTLLRDAVTQFLALRDGLAAARKADDPDGLATLVQPLAGLATRCRAHPLLATLFPL